MIAAGADQVEAFLTVAEENRPKRRGKSSARVNNQSNDTFELYSVLL
jgi:hypothetical protein